MVEMLSAMTTSENYPLSSQPRCSTSTYRALAKSAFGAQVRDECRQFLLDSAYSSPVFDASDDLEGSFPAAREDPCGEEVTNASAVYDTISVAVDEVPKLELETDISELLEQLDLEDLSYEQSKPLKIDANLLKLDFSNASSVDLSSGNGGVTNYKSLDEFCTGIARENKRASHHLSGGGLLTDASQDSVLQGLPEGASRSRFCSLSDGGCISTENIFDFDDLSYFVTDDRECKSSNFLNQISPSSPLTCSEVSHHVPKDVARGDRADPESTNPFTSFLKDPVDEESAFSSTNPFRSLNLRSSLDQTCNPPVEYENLAVPNQSFSQCSTRPASPVGKSNPDEPCVCNPFLLNQTSPQSCSSLNLSQFFGNGGASPQPATNHQSPFIFAVPVIPIFQHHIANSSTQTCDPPVGQSPSPEEPVYQNVTNQLKKFTQRNNHSEYDLQCLKTTMKDLMNCGWYYGNISWQESIVLLKDTEPGTFLIRDSSDPNFLFSLSVQTSRGPTSVRLHYVNGQFRLDAEEKLIPHMPSFNTVADLVDYYIENTVKNKFVNSHFKKVTRKSGKEKLQKSKEQVWIDSQGKIYSNILLVKPLYKKDHFSSLQHLTRLAINRHLRSKMNAKARISFRVTPVYESSPFQDSSFPNALDNFCPILNVDGLPLPVTLLNYLKDYPYCH